MVYSTLFGTTTTWTGNDIDNGLNGLVTADINGTYSYAGVASGTNTITASLSQSPGSYTAGLRVFIVSGGTNSGSATLNLNSLGAITIYNSLTGIALIGGEMLSGSLYELVYYNSLFYLINPRPGVTTWTPTFTGFSANPTYVATYFRIGNMVTATLRCTADGTSNATGFTVTSPLTAVTRTSAQWSARCHGANSNGVHQADVDVLIASAGTVFTLQVADVVTGWNAAGNKKANFTITYECA